MSAGGSVDPHLHALDKDPVEDWTGPDGPNPDPPCALGQGVENESSYEQSAVTRPKHAEDQAAQLAQEQARSDAENTGLQRASSRACMGESEVAHAEEVVEDGIQTNARFNLSLAEVIFEAERRRPHMHEILDMLNQDKRGGCCAALTQIIINRLERILRCLVYHVLDWRTYSIKIEGPPYRHRDQLESLLLQADQKHYGRLLGDMILFQEYHDWFISFMPLMGIYHDAEIERAIVSDVLTLCRKMTSVLLLADHDEEILSLRDVDADRFSYLLHQTLNGLGPFKSKSFQDGIASRRRRALWLMLKLAHTSGVIPSFLYIEGVNIQELQHPVGMGSYSDVFAGTYNGTSVAVKRLRLKFSDSSSLHKHRQRLCREALPWRQLKHPNILPFLGLLGKNKNFADDLFLISPYMSNGDILGYIRAQASTVSQVLSMVPIFSLPLLQTQYPPPQSVGIAEGVAYLHGEDVVHGDLRAVNVLVGDHGQIQLSDFGLVSFMAMKSLDGSSYMAGNLRWMAPELLRPGDDSPRRTYASDIYSMGSLFYELFTRGPPFVETKVNSAVLLRVLDGARPRRPTSKETESGHIPNDAWTLMLECWHDRPEARPRAADLITLLNRSAIGPAYEHAVKESGDMMPEKGLLVDVVPAKPVIQPPNVVRLRNEMAGSQQLGASADEMGSKGSNSSRHSRATSYYTAFSSFGSDRNSYASASDLPTSAHRRHRRTSSVRGPYRSSVL